MTSSLGRVRTQLRRLGHGVYGILKFKHSVVQECWHWGDGSTVYPSSPLLPRLSHPLDCRTCSVGRWSSGTGSVKSPPSQFIVSLERLWRKQDVDLAKSQSTELSKPNQETLRMDLSHVYQKTQLRSRRHLSLESTCQCLDCLVVLPSFQTHPFEL